MTIPSGWCRWCARARSCVIAFQIGYTVLDGGEFPHTFARTLPLHIVGIALGLAAFMQTLSPRAMRSWRAISLAICWACLACTASIAVINGNSDVLVGSIVLLFFGTGSLIPWSPRWQVALEASGAIALLAYTMQTADSSSKLSISWMMLLGAAVLSQLSSVHGTRHRTRLAAQVAALLESHRLLTREMEQREQSSRAGELESKRRQQSESMLSKVFEASPDNIAVNSLVDGRFIAVNDAYRVAGYTRDDVMGTTVTALGTWPHQPELIRFLKGIQQTGRVKNMEITQRRKDGAIEMNLISASVVEVNGESCVISMTRDITEIKRTETRLLAGHAALRKFFRRHSTRS